MSREEFLRRLEEAGTCWAATVLLLRFWRAAIPERPAWRSDGADYDGWADLAGEVAAHFEQEHHLDEEGSLTDQDRRLIRAWTRAGADPDAVHAVAWGLDNSMSSTFAVAWRDGLCSGGEAVHRMATGDIYPIADPPWVPAEGHPHSARPASLTQPDVGELPHVRVRADDGFEAWADFRFDEDLYSVLHDLRSVATAHPNASIDEFVLARSGPHQIFPVTPLDPRRQHEHVLQAVGEAFTTGARIVVVPELATTPEIVDELRRELASRDEGVLVIAGSFHTTVAGRRENRALGLLADFADEALTHTKIVPFADELRLRPPLKEGIATMRPRRITLFHSRAFRLAIVICRDFLDGSVGAVLDRLGANVICVPAMSERTAAFLSRASARIDGAQAISVIGNGPLRWHTESDESRPTAMAAFPVDGRQPDVVISDDISAPGSVLFPIPLFFS